MTASKTVRVAVEGCGHGTLDAIYASVQKSCEIRGWDSVDLVIICGDFQAVRTRLDLNVTAMPAKYRKMGDFHQYYYGTKKAPYLTVFIGGNHEASNHLFELYYGGWAAPNIYYLGAANVLQLGPIKIAAMSGIWKGHDYRKPHFERLPYNHETMRSIYHQRELDVRKLLAYRSQVDIGLSHDWPHEMWKLGDHDFLLRIKPYFREDASKDNLGSKAATQVVGRLRPPYWFCAHMHVKYAAFKNHDTSNTTNGSQGIPQTNFDETTEAMSSQPTRVLKKETDTSNGTDLFVKRDTDLHNTSAGSGKTAAVSAWSEFSNTIQAQDAREYDDEQEAKREQEQLNGRQTTAEYRFQETFKPMSVGQLDGTQSRRSKSPATHLERIPQVDGACCSMPKYQRKSSPSNEAQASGRLHNSAQTDGAAATDATVTNPDAIDISMSDSDEEGDAKPLLSKDADQINNATSKVPHDQNLSLPANAENTYHSKTDRTELDKPKQTDEEDDVPEDIRAQLAEMSATFASKDHIRSADLPFPENITNKETRYLALSKVEKGHERDFLQLLEIEPINSTENSQPLNKPLKLSYDPEWLAILRTFASELQLGGSEKDPTPSHRGDTLYRDKITEEEKWVKENIVDKGFLEVPENFEVTVQDDLDQSKIKEHHMPREQTNPQTTKFCDLIGIENKFDFSEKDRDARIAAGAPSGRNFQGRRRGRGGSRGRGQGGRAGYDGGTGGRGRW